MSFYRLLAGLVAATVMGASAQAASLITQTTVDNSAAGEMFDVSATNEVTVTGLSAAVDGPGNYKVYTRLGTHVGHETTAADWTLVGTATLAGAGLQPLGVAMSLDVPAGQTRAFYIISTSGTATQYKDSANAVGTVQASDANISILTGSAETASGDNFSGTVYTKKDFVGEVDYDLGPPPPVPTLTEWAMIALTAVLLGFGLWTSRPRRATA